MNRSFVIGGIGVVVIFIAIVLNYAANRTVVDVLPESGQSASNSESLTQSDDSKSPPGEIPLEQVVENMNEIFIV